MCIIYDFINYFIGDSLEKTQNEIKNDNDSENSFLQVLANEHVVREFNEIKQNFERLLFHNYEYNMENINMKLHELIYLYYMVYDRFKRSNAGIEELIPKIDAAEILIKQLFNLMTEIAIDLE